MVQSIDHSAVAIVDDVHIFNPGDHSAAESYFRVDNFFNETFKVDNLPVCAKIIQNYFFLKEKDNSEFRLSIIEAHLHMDSRLCLTFMAWSRSLQTNSDCTPSNGFQALLDFQSFMACRCSLQTNSDCKQVKLNFRLRYGKP